MAFPEWNEMESAPKNEWVLVCLSDCEILVARQEEYEGYSEKGKSGKYFGWFPARQYFGNGGRQIIKPHSWQELPLPPKHLYDRKVQADWLRKQLAAIESFTQ